MSTPCGCSWFLTCSYSQTLQVHFVGVGLVSSRMFTFLSSECAPGSRRTLYSTPQSTCSLYPACCTTVKKGGEIRGGQVRGEQIRGGEIGGWRLRKGRLRMRLSGRVNKDAEIKGGEINGGEINGGEINGGEINGGEIKGGEIKGSGFYRLGD